MLAIALDAPGAGHQSEVLGHALGRRFDPCQALFRFGDGSGNLIKLAVDRRQAFAEPVKLAVHPTEKLERVVGHHRCLLSRRVRQVQASLNAVKPLSKPIDAAALVGNHLCKRRLVRPQACEIAPHRCKILLDRCKARAVLKLIVARLGPRRVHDAKKVFQRDFGVVRHDEDSIAQIPTNFADPRSDWHRPEGLLQPRMEEFHVDNRNVATFVSNETPAPVVFEKDGRIVATSVDVASGFEKQHKHVLRDIDNLLKQRHDLNGSKFGPVEYFDAKGEARRAFEMDRDGFTLLAMGFTGAKALDFKIRYIDAFNRMEQALTDQSAGMEIAVARIVDQLISKRIPELIEAQLTRDPMRAAVHHIPALQVAIDKKVEKRPRGLTQKISGCLTRYCERRGLTISRDARQTKLFPREAVTAWLAADGWLEVATWLQRKQGGPSLFDVLEFPGGAQK